MGIHREVFQVHGTFCSYCQPRDMIVSWLLARKEGKNTACGKDRKLERHRNSAGREARKRAGTNKAHFSILRHQEHVVYSFFPSLSAPNIVKLQIIVPKPGENTPVPWTVGFYFLTAWWKTTCQVNHDTLISYLSSRSSVTAIWALPTPPSPTSKHAKTNVLRSSPQTSHISIGLRCISRFLLYLSFYWPPGVLKATRAPPVVLNPAQLAIRPVFLQATVR